MPAAAHRRPSMPQPQGRLLCMGGCRASHSKHDEVPVRFATMFTSCSAVMANHIQAQGFAIAEGAAV